MPLRSCDSALGNAAQVGRGGICGIILAICQRAQEYVTYPKVTEFGLSSGWSKAASYTADRSCIRSLHE